MEFFLAEIRDGKRAKLRKQFQTVLIKNVENKTNLKFNRK